MSTVDFIQTFAIILALAVSIIQMRVYSKSTRASTYPAIMSRLDAINHMLIEYPEVAANFSEPYLGREKTLTNDRRPGLMYMILSFYEELFLHNKYGYMESEVWEGWGRSMKRVLGQPYASGFWKEVREEHYGKSFQVFIDELIEEKSGPQDSKQDFTDSAF